jgi:hypothetical protein
MLRLTTVLLALLPAAALAEGFQPPVPQAETAAAELSYAVASVLLIATLAAAGWLVGRR